MAWPPERAGLLHVHRATGHCTDEQKYKASVAHALKQKQKTMHLAIHCDVK